MQTLMVMATAAQCHALRHAEAPHIHVFFGIFFCANLR